MAQGLFITGFTVAEVLQILENHKKILFEVKTVKSWTDGGTMVSKEFGIPILEVLKECKYALRVLDPATYGPRRNVAQSSVVGYLPL